MPENTQNTPSPPNLLDLSVRDFAAAAAAKTPTPGGGSVAGAVASLAVALGEMALNFTKGKKKFAAHQAFHDRLSKRMEKARKMFQDLVSDDVAAYGMYRQATGAEDGPQKAEALQLAVAAATNVPREMAKLAMAVMEDLQSLCDKCNPYLISDLLASAALCAAVMRLCDYNVRINVPQIADRTAAADISAAAAADLARANELLDAIEKAAAAHMG